MNTIISIKIAIPFSLRRSLKSTAHGYMNITSTSNNTNKMATRKYLIENGIRALPRGSIPHSKESSLILPFLLGPSIWVDTMVNPTKPAATKNISAIGKYSTKYCSSIMTRVRTKPFRPQRSKFFGFYLPFRRIYFHYFITV